MSEITGFFSGEEHKEIDDYLTEQFEFDKLVYTTLDFRGAAVATTQQVDELSVKLIKSLNNLQLIYGGVSAIGIAIGFLMLNTGTISQKNTTTMLRVSLIENMICAFGIWCLGYRISMNSIGGLIGTGLDFDFFNTVDDEHCIHYIVLFACAQFTSAITTGALAERTYVDTQMAFKVMLNVLIFPIIASWVWGGGWLAEYGYQDFGGSGFHIVGGTCGLVGANFLGPRLGLFKESLPLAENRIRDKIEKREHVCSNLRIDQQEKLKQQRDQVIKYLRIPQELLIQPSFKVEDHYGKSFVLNCVKEIQRKIFRYNSLDDRMGVSSYIPAAKPSRTTDDISFSGAKILEPEKNKRKGQEGLSHSNLRRRSSSADSNQLSRKKSQPAGMPHERGQKVEQKAKRHSNSSSSNLSLIQDQEIFMTVEDREIMTEFYKNLPSSQRSLVKSIVKLDREIRLLGAQISSEHQKIDRMREKYVAVFRARNPDLRHFKIEQIKDYTDLLIKESQNLRQPNSVILVAGGVLFIFFGTFSLSILITRVFYKEYMISGTTSDVFLPQAHRLMEVGFHSMIDKLASVSGSVISVLLLKPLIYGHWRTQEQTSCVYNVETISSSIIAGIASIAGASGNVEIHAAIIIGVIGGIIYMVSSLILNRFQLDDPLQATQTHLFCGLWGVIAFGLLHKEKGLLTMGLGRFLGIQLLGAAVIWFFSFALTFAFFRLVTKRFHLRLSKVEEVLGLDCQEDEIRMQAVTRIYLNESNRENMARLALIQLVRTGSHVSKKKKRSQEAQHYHQQSQNFDLSTLYSFKRQNNLWKHQSSKISQSIAQGAGTNTAQRSSAFK